VRGAHSVGDELEVEERAMQEHTSFSSRRFFSSGSAMVHSFGLKGGKGNVWDAVGLEGGSGRGGGGATALESCKEEEAVARMTVQTATAGETLEEAMC
jgi:hypothetical protein